METIACNSIHVYSQHSKLPWHEQTTHLSKELLLRNTLKLFIICNDRNHPAKMFWCMERCKDAQRLCTWQPIAFLSNFLSLCLKCICRCTLNSRCRCNWKWLVVWNKKDFMTNLKELTYTLLGRAEFTDLQEESRRLTAKQECPLGLPPLHCSWWNHAIWGPVELCRCALPYKQMSEVSWEQTL